MPYTSERLHALDAVRAFALLSGIFLHASVFWLADASEVGIDETPSNTAAGVYYFIHIFRMPVFFLIAGYFGRLVTEKRGVAAFVRDRAKRIALPLSVGVVVIPMFTLAAFSLGALASGMSVADLMALTQAFTGQEVRSANFGPPELGFLGHLWFLYYLLIFYAGALLVRHLGKAPDRVVRVVMRSGLAPVAFGLPVAAYYVFGWHEWPGWTGLPNPASVIPFAPALVGYGVFFIVGWLLHRQTDLLLQLRDKWVGYTVAGTVLAVTSYVIAGPTPHWSAYLDGSKLYVYAVTYMTAAWSLSFALIGLGLRFLSDHSPTRRYLADSSYWLYLMHLAPITFFVALLDPLDWHWGFKYVIMIAASIPLLLLSYHYLVRYTFIGATLNGRRQEPAYQRGD
ncbi:hypothetical protein AU189_24685 [Mycolicibacterium acapulense]|nr:hypothetical protein AU189_24685 [Mycolicibacterium acapulense]